MAASRVKRAIWGEALAALVAVAVALGLAWVTLTRFADMPWQLAVGALLLAGLTARFGWTTLRGTGARVHGTQLERKAVRAATRALPKAGITLIAAGREYAGIGDVDLLARIGGCRVAIEIKSYRHWTPDSRRAKAAMAQVAREATASRAQGCVVWLPDAPARWFSRPERVGDVVIAKGGTKSLIKAIRSAA